MPDSHPALEQNAKKSPIPFAKHDASNAAKEEMAVCLKQII
jgi:hypothetical protein